MRSDLPTGTVTFLFSDIEGSTRLLGRLGADVYAEALAGHRRALRDAFAAEDGVEVDTQGDAFFVAFPTASGAAAAAHAAQEALRGGPISVRMGLHTGTPKVTAEGYVGIDVHRGARVAALAHGGQVIMSAATAALLEGTSLRDLGRHRLKDFDTPVHLFQLGTEAHPPLRTPGAVDLPTPATHFLGRERELLHAAGIWLEHEPRVLTIVGPGGVGKTRFAIELARFLADDAEGGTTFVALAPLRDAGQVLPLIAERLGAAEDGAEAVAACLGERQTHVLLDNLEHLLPDAATTLAELLAAAPTLRLLVTSREPLRIHGETELDLPPLGEPDAVSLFLERARAIRGDLTESPTVHELTRRLDGLPLAIELAAARVKLLAPEQLLERIGQRLDLLKGGRDEDERHATLRATIAWSHDLLDGEEQQLFRRLAVFRGGCRLESAEKVCGAEIDALASLLDKSLLRRRQDPDGQERFWMLGTIRDFARERLEESGEEDEVRAAQADGLIELADEAGTSAIVDQPRAWSFDLVAPEIDNVRSVLDWALERDPVRGLVLATGLEAYWVVRDAVEGAARLEALLARASGADPRLRATALRALGGATDIVGDHDRAAPCYRESLELFDAVGDEVEAAHVRLRIVANMVMRGETDAAWPLLEASLRESRELEQPIAESQALGFLAHKAYGEGDLELALAETLESADLARQVGWTWWEMGQLAAAASIERERGRLDDAERLARRALDLSIEMGERRLTVFVTAELAVVASQKGDAERAGILWGAVDAEASRGRVGQWETDRAGIEALLENVACPEFERGRGEGRLLSIAQAVETADALDGTRS